jgi:hypothetical protein
MGFSFDWGCELRLWSQVVPWGGSDAPFAGLLFGQRGQLLGGFSIHDCCIVRRVLIDENERQSRGGILPELLGPQANCLGSHLVGGYIDCTPDLLPVSFDSACIRYLALVSSVSKAGGASKVVK